MHWKDEDGDDLEWEGWQDDDKDVEGDLLPCPECGAMIYEDTDQCPACGMYVMPLAHAGRSRSWITVLVVIAVLAGLAVWIFS